MTKVKNLRIVCYFETMTFFESLYNVNFPSEFCNMMFFHKKLQERDRWTSIRSRKVQRRNSSNGRITFLGKRNTLRSEHVLFKQLHQRSTWSASPELWRHDLCQDDKGNRRGKFPLRTDPKQTRSTDKSLWYASILWCLNFQRFKNTFHGNAFHFLWFFLDIFKK